MELKKKKNVNVFCYYQTIISVFEKLFNLALGLKLNFLLVVVLHSFQVGTLFRAVTNWASLIPYI